MSKDTFDARAASWDQEPRRLKLAGEVLAAMRAEVPMAADHDVLDFGSGTGLIGLALAPLVRSVICVDSSQGMRDILTAKAAALPNARVLEALPRPEQVAPGLQRIVSSMTLHHVADVPGLLRSLLGLLAPGGQLCVADLDPDAGLFHPEAHGVEHEGFERQALADMFRAAGYAGVRHRQAASIRRPGRDGIERSFSVFLMAGHRPG